MGNRTQSSLQNRVSPDGSLHRETARGMFTGNRGIIHDPNTRQLLGRRWTTSAWICCSLEWKGQKREVWRRNGPGRSAGWSELFFLDEVTALAAGHRPCHMCRRSAANAFHDAYCAANGALDAVEKNRLLHRERWFSAKEKPSTIQSPQLSDLPDGTVIKIGEIFYALKNHKLLVWNFDGYNGKSAEMSDLVSAPMQLVTPPSIIGALKMGYRPQWHPSAS